MSARPLPLESKASERPSGDQRGDPVMGPSKCVILFGSLPSLRQIQISFAPDRSLRNAIDAPSGEYTALASKKLEAMNGSASRRTSIGRRHTETLFGESTYASRCPTGETVGEEVCVSGVVTAVGGPPSRGRLQIFPRLVARPEEKIIRFPSELHARPSMGFDREVSFRSVPPAAGTI